MRILAGATENICKAVVHAVSDKQPHREKRHQLYHRFKCNRGHQPFVALGRIQMARAEQNGKHRQHHGDVKGVVADEQLTADFFRHGDAGVVQNNREAGGDGFQLQRDIWNDADHRDHRHQAAEQLAFAVARRDKIRNRSDAVGLAHAQDFYQQQPPQCCHQRGAQINRQEADAAGGRATYAAVERPRGAVDRERQCVNVRVGDEAAAGVRAFVAIGGNGEQQPHIRKRGDNNDAAGEHGRLRLLAVFNHQRHQPDQCRPGAKHVTVEHGQAQDHAVAREQLQQRIVEQQHAQQE